MKAVIVTDPGEHDKLEVRELPDPQPGKGEVVIDISHSCCNWGDIQKRQGVYPAVLTFPLITGTESSGVISAIGEGVEGWQIGQRVSAIHLFGGHAEKVAVPTEYVIALPDAMSFEMGAVFPLVSLTAYHLLHTAFEAKAGQTILVHAIGGGVGLMLTQIAKKMGVKVLGTTGSGGDKAKRPLAYGAHRVIDRNTEDFVAVALEETDGKGVDLVIDSVGGETCLRSFDALRHFGHLINIGEADEFPSGDLRDKLYERSTSFSGFETDHAMFVENKWTEGISYVTNGLLSGDLEIPIVAQFRLEELVDAHKLLESRTVSGKILIKI